MGEQIDEKLDAGIDVVSATYVTPYPPGFPVLVPGQVVSREILQFMRDLDTKEIHGYEPNFGYRVYTEKAIEMVGAAAGLPSNGHHATTESRRRRRRRSRSSAVAMATIRRFPRSGRTSCSASGSPATR